MTHKKLNRRFFLRGMGSVVVSLPLLDVMLDGHGEAFAAGESLPTRYLVCFHGVSNATDGRTNEMTPSAVGTGYDIPPALKSIGELGVQDQISVVSGIRAPQGQESTAGWYTRFHDAAFVSILTGASGFGNNNQSEFFSPSSDIVMADEIGAQSIIQSLHFKAQLRSEQIFGTKWRDSISYEMKGAQKNVIQMQTSPGEAYQQIFGKFNAASTGTPQEVEPTLEEQLRVSCLSAVRDDSKKLIAMLGKNDKARMERHFDEIRDLEKRISASQSPVEGTPSTQCKKPNMPKATEDSNYNERARQFMDLIHMAYTCNLSRVAAMQLTQAQCTLSMKSIVGYGSTDVHKVSHRNAGLGAKHQEALNDIISKGVEHFSYLVKKLRDTPEGDGTVLDQCAMVFTLEGGGNGSAHSGENMVALLAGGGAGNLNPGQHIKLNKEHIGVVFNTAMKAVGAQKNFGDMTSVISNA